MFPQLEKKYTQRSKNRDKRYQSAPSLNQQSFSMQAFLNQNHGYSNQYHPSTFNFQSYMTRPFQHKKIKKSSLAMQNHKKRILPLMDKFNNLLNFYEQKRFGPPKKIKHIKPRPPLIIEYEPNTGVRAGYNTPINSDRPNIKPKKAVVFDDGDDKKKTPVEKSLNLELIQRVKDLWAKVRRLYRFLQFPLWWYRREHRILTNLREIIVKYQMENYDKVMGILRNRGMKMAFKSLQSIWYDTLDFNLVFDQSILDTYLLQSEASDEDFFVEHTQDRAKSVQEFAQNFTVENIGENVFDFMKILMMKDTTFISNFLTLPETKRLRFRYCGLTAQYSNSMRKMVLAFFLIVKFLLPDVLGFPLFYIKEYSIEPKKRLQLRVLGSIVYYAIWEFCYEFLPQALEPEKLIKEEYRFEVNFGYFYTDKLLYPPPLAPKVYDETVVLGDLIEKKYLKSYFINEERFEKLKFVTWKAIDKILTRIQEYESKDSDEVFAKIKGVYDTKIESLCKEKPVVKRIDGNG